MELPVVHNGGVQGGEVRGSRAGRLEVGGGIARAWPLGRERGREGRGEERSEGRREGRGEVRRVRVPLLVFKMPCCCPIL